MKTRRLVFVLTVLWLALAAPGWAQEKRSITETDLFKFNWIADPQI